MIANCPSCGTHYKHEPPKVKVRARCGRCDTTLDLTRFRPYRIVPDRAPTADEAARAARYLPIGLDHPNLATSIALNVAHPKPLAATAAPSPTPRVQDAPPAAPAGGPSVARARPVADKSADQTPADVPLPELVGYDTPAPRKAGVVGYALSITATAAAGAAASWAAGGTTVIGAAAGAAIGVVGWWGWRRWTSPK